MRKERIDFRNRCKEKIHVGDMVEIANPTEILNNCKYAVLVEKVQDADFDEAIIDVNSSHVFLVDSFKSIYNKKVKVLDIDSDGISIDVSDFPSHKPHA